jgi:hypothetical protein
MCLDVCCLFVCVVAMFVGNEIEGAGDKDKRKSFSVS